MEEYYKQFHHAVTTIENGYDNEAFERAKLIDLQDVPTRIAGKVIRYMGTVMRDRIPRNFLSSLSAMPSQVRQTLLVEFYGESKMLHDVIQVEFPDLMGCIEYKKKVPYLESLNLMLRADALLFMETSSSSSLSAKGVLTTKLFEYLAAGRPIVADIAPETLAGQVIVNSGLGLVCSNDPCVIANALQKLLTGNYAVTPNAHYISTFSREAQAKRFEQVLQDITNIKSQKV
jgi:glycosyltransferase involved in cell wall biosynthesis